MSTKNSSKALSLSQTYEFVVSKLWLTSVNPWGWRPNTRELLIYFSTLTVTKDAFFGDYFRIGILAIDGIFVLLGAIPFSE